MKEFVNELIMCPKCGAEGSVRWVRKFNAREDRALMNHFIDETHELLGVHSSSNSSSGM